MDRLIRRMRSARTRVMGLLPDKLYVHLYYFKHKHVFPNLRNPLSFCEKIQWLKVHGNMERFSRYADKYTVREFVQQSVGNEYLIPLLGVWDRFEDIPFDSLPNSFVLKVTHGCGYNVICKDKSLIDIPSLKKTVSKWLHDDFYKHERETQYKLCQPRIICEEYKEDASGNLCDYKFWCSKGKVKMIQVDIDRFTDHKSVLHDTRWRVLRHAQSSTFGTIETPIPKPAQLSQMIALAKRLSASFPFVRVDLYAVGTQIYFGELTFTPGSGMVDFESKRADVELGKLIDLKAYNNPVLATGILQVGNKNHLRFFRSAKRNKYARADI